MEQSKCSGQYNDDQGYYQCAEKSNVERLNQYFRFWQMMPFAANRWNGKARNDCRDIPSGSIDRRFPDIAPSFVIKSFRLVYQWLG